METKNLIYRSEMTANDFCIQNNLPTSFFTFVDVCNYLGLDFGKGSARACLAAHVARLNKNKEVPNNNEAPKETRFNFNVQNSIVANDDNKKEVLINAPTTEIKPVVKNEPKQTANDSETAALLAKLIGGYLPQNNTLDENRVIELIKKNG